MGSRRATDAEVERWRDEGWVLLEGLVDEADVDAALDDLRIVFPSPEAYHADPEGVTRRWKGSPVTPEEDYVWPPEGPGFRPEQQRWMAAFPFAGSGSLNRLCVHPSIVDFAERALETPDIRLYQAHANAKYSGLTNYEQPMHTDRNHSWLPAVGRGPWWNLEGFCYLSDVTGSENPTRLVSVADSANVTTKYPVILPAMDPELYAAERAAPDGGARTWPTDRTSSTGGHPSVHRARPASCSHWPSNGPGRTGSVTTRRSPGRPARSGPPSPSTPRHASSSCSASRLPDTRSGARSSSPRRPAATRLSISVRGTTASSVPAPAPTPAPPSAARAPSGVRATRRRRCARPSRAPGREDHLMPEGPAIDSVAVNGVEMYAEVRGQRGHPDGRRPRWFRHRTGDPASNHPLRHLRVPTPWRGGRRLLRLSAPTRRGRRRLVLEAPRKARR